MVVEHRGRRQARDDAPLRPRARPRAHRAGADHASSAASRRWRSRSSTPPTSPRRDTSSVRSVSYGGAPAPPRAREADQGGLPRWPARQRLRADRDVGGDLDEHGARLRGASGLGGHGRARHRRRRRARGLRGRRAARGPCRAVPRSPASCGCAGPRSCAGYWNRPEETALVFTNGWLHTGDVARIDDEGYIYIVDRAKDVIIRGGRERLLRRGRGRALRAPRRRGLRGDRRAASDPRRGGGRGRDRSRGAADRPTRTLRRHVARAPRAPTTCRRGSGSARDTCRATPRARCSSASCATSSSRPERARLGDAMVGRQLAASSSSVGALAVVERERGRRAVLLEVRDRRGPRDRQHDRRCAAAATRARPARRWRRARAPRGRRRSPAPRARPRRRGSTG